MEELETLFVSFMTAVVMLLYYTPLAQALDQTNKHEQLYYIDWSTMNFDGKYETKIDFDHRYKGQATVHIKGPNDAHGFTSSHQQFSAKNYRGQRIIFSGYIRAEDVAGWAGLWMNVEGADRVVAFDNMESRPIKGTTKFKPYSVVLDVPKDALFIKIGFSLCGKGDVWVSNLSLNTTDNSVASTGEDPSKFAGMLPADLLYANEPKNMDFSLADLASVRPPNLRYWKGEGTTDDFEMKVLPTGGSDGKSALELKSKPRVRDTIVRVRQSINAAPYRMKRVRFSCAIRTENVYPIAGMDFRVCSRRSLEDFDPYWQQSIKGSTDWQRYSCVLDVSESATFIEFGVFFYGVGTIRCSDPRFELVDATVPVTSHLEKFYDHVHRLKPIFIDFENY